MHTRPHTPTSPGPSALRRRGAKAVLAVMATVVASAVLLAACSSSSSTGSGTTASAPPTSSAARTLASLQKWPSAPVALQETGSSLLYPLFNLWTKKIEQSWPDVSITTASTGSGTGISAAAAGTVNIGASDAYLSPGQAQQYPDLENIPLAISAQQINYNVPGVSAHLKLDGPALAAMYEGKISRWNDPKIAALNPGVALPDIPVVPVHRSDSSGDTFLFSSFLAASDPSGWTVPPGTTVAWPDVATAVAAQGNGGMVQACQHSAGCVAYIGISYLSEATTAGLGYAAVKNKSGNYELPSQSTAEAEAASFAASTPSSGAVSMIFGPADNGYPIVNYEYAIVPTTQPTAAAAQAVKAVLGWAIDPSGGSAPSYLDQVGFVALPAQVVAVSTRLIARIGQ